MRRMQTSLASSVDVAEIDREYAYLIWIVEHEFNVGPIGPDFPVAKLWNLSNENHIRRFNESQKGGSAGPIQTLGR